jgi:hypothetical protein
MMSTICQILLTIRCLARSKKRLFQRSYRAKDVDAIVMLLQPAHGPDPASSKALSRGRLRHKARLARWDKMVQWPVMSKGC